MRIAYLVVAALLTVSALPSVSFAQIVIPDEREAANYAAPLEATVPVATVTLPADAIVLDHPQQGSGFVVGAANLDFKDRSHPMIVFTFSNAAEMAIPLSKVGFRSVRVNSRFRDGRTFVSCGVWSRLSRSAQGETALQPGAAITVSMPVPPTCPELGETVGFLIFLESVAPKSPLYKTDRIDARLRSAFRMLSQSQE
jgi:hypothetical protein